MNTDYDVVVVGGGNAALCAALSAHEAGARVLVLEAAPREERGGNSRFAGAIFRAPHTGIDGIMPLLGEEAQADLEKVRIAPYTADDFRHDMLATSDNRADRDQMEIVIRDGYATMEWMRDQGVHWELTLRKFFNPEALEHVIELPGGGAIKARGEGIGLTDDLWAAVEQIDIEVRYDHPAHDLLIEGDTVLGVRVRAHDSFEDFGAQVILACGGFEANPALRRRYLGEGWDLVVVRGTRFNTGTMLEKAIVAGAQAYGHWGGCHSSPQDVNAPRVGDLAVTDEMSRYSYPYAIMVNVDGQRFMDEGEDIFAYTYAKTGSEIRRQPRATAFQIFDQKTIHLLEPRYRTATPIVDDTIEGLAGKLGINPGGVQRHGPGVQRRHHTGGGQPVAQGRSRHRPRALPPEVQLGESDRSAALHRLRSDRRDHVHLRRPARRHRYPGAQQRGSPDAGPLRRRRDYRRILLPQLSGWSGPHPRRGVRADRRAPSGTPSPRGDGRE